MRGKGEVAQMVEKAWETLNNAMPDELFDQSRHRRADARRIASALEVIGNLTGRPAELREWYPRFSSVDEVPTLEAASVANALEKEVLALQVMGRGAARGVTWADKLALYTQALENISERARGREKMPVTWAAFKNSVAAEVNRLAHQEVASDGEESVSGAG